MPADECTLQKYRLCWQFLPSHWSWPHLLDLLPLFEGKGQKWKKPNKCFLRSSQCPKYLESCWDSACWDFTLKHCCCGWTHINPEFVSSNPRNRSIDWIAALSLLSWNRTCCWNWACWSSFSRWNSFAIIYWSGCSRGGAASGSCNFSDSRIGTSGGSCCRAHWGWECGSCNRGDSGGRHIIGNCDLSYSDCDCRERGDCLDSGISRECNNRTRNHSSTASRGTHHSLNNRQQGIGFIKLNLGIGGSSRWAWGDGSFSLRARGIRAGNICSWITSYLSHSLGTH